MHGYHGASLRYDSSQEDAEQIPSCKGDLGAVFVGGGGCSLNWPKSAVKACRRTQLLATTHSPFFLNALRPEEVRVLWRDEQGYTQARRAADLPGVSEFVDHGALLGHLWMEGQLGVGDPLVNQGAPTRPLGGRGR